MSQPAEPAISKLPGPLRCLWEQLQAMQIDLRQSLSDEVKQQIAEALGWEEGTTKGHLTELRRELSIPPPDRSTWSTKPAAKNGKAPAAVSEEQPKESVMGRPSIVTAEKSLEVQEVLRAGGSVQQAADRIGVHRNTIYYAAKSDAALAKAIQARGVAEDQGAVAPVSPEVAADTPTAEEPVAPAAVANTAPQPPGPGLVALREMREAFDQFALDVSENCMSSISELNDALRETRAALEKERQRYAELQKHNDWLEDEISRMEMETEVAGVPAAGILLPHSYPDLALKLACGDPVSTNEGMEELERLATLKMAVRALEAILTWKPSMRVIIVPAEVKPPRLDRRETDR